jgi:hypothetical protein
MRAATVERELVNKVPVYGLTVVGTHNFTLANDLFVHNSKDTMDAICGVYNGLTHLRIAWETASKQGDSVDVRKVAERISADAIRQNPVRPSVTRS